MAYGNSSYPSPGGNGASVPSVPGMEGIPTGPLIEDSDELLQAITTRKKRAVQLDLTEEEETNLIIQIDNDISTGVSHQREFRANHLEFVRNWRMKPEDKSDHPLGDLAANVKVPFTATIIEQWKSRMMKLIFGEARICKFTSLNPSLKDDLTDVTDWFDYELRNVVN